jgi:hypothetical protein
LIRFAAQSPGFAEGREVSQEESKKKIHHRDTEARRSKAREKEERWRNRSAFRPTLGGGVRCLEVFLLLFLQKKKALLA